MEFSRQVEPPGRASRLRRALAEVPSSLAALLAIVVVVGLSWALIVPPWQAPDASTHFAYAQSLAERFALPGDKQRTSISSDQTLADIAVHASLGAFNVGTVKPDWSATAYARYLAAARRDPSRSNGGGPNSAASNPPLYYLYADLAYWAAYGGDAFDRLYAMQIWGVPLLMLTVLGAWLLAGEVLGRQRLPQLVCAAAAGFVPMETFISTSVNPDALMIAMWTMALWLGARVINRGARRRDAVAMCAFTAAAVLTKATSYALIPAILFALLAGWFRRPKENRGSAIRELGAPLLALAVPVVAWVGLASELGRPAVNAVPSGGRLTFNVRQFISYVWQFYLPRLPFLTPFREVDGLPLYYVWIREGWGIFGWLDVPMPGWVYSVVTAASAVILVPAVALIAHFRDRLRLSLVVFFALAVAGLLGLLHITDYALLIAGGGAILQGRYLLPVISLFGLAVGFLVLHTPPRWRAAVCGVVLAALLLMQILALATVARMYYT